MYIIGKEFIFIYLLFLYDNLFIFFFKFIFY